MTETTTSSLDSFGDLDDLTVPRSIKIQKLAFRSYAGVMPKVTFEVTFRELAETFNFKRLLTRHDYDVEDTSHPGNRAITESHVKKIAAGIRSTDRPYLGTITVAMDPEHVDIQPLRDIADHLDLVQVTIYEGAPNPVVEDGQHRIAMATEVWPDVRDADEGDAARVREYLEKTSVEVTVLLEGDPDVLSTIFVRMGSTKPISPNLIAVMDKGTVQNRLGLHVMRKSQLLANRVGYQPTTTSRALAAKRGRVFEDFYPAAAARSAAASMAGVGVRDRTPEQREKILKEVVDEKARLSGISEEAAIEDVGNEVIAILDYAYRTLPGWREISQGILSVAEFKKQYVHSSAAGLYVVANTVAAARAAGLNPHAVVDAMAKLPWRRDALRSGKDDRGRPNMVHEFFEGTLASTTYDTKNGEWRAGTAGATRSNYEPAIAKVLRAVAQSDRSLEPLASRTTAVTIGLVAAKAGPGRPRKNAETD